jgi:hypothetical protein
MEVVVHATVYVRAGSMEEAQEKARRLERTAIEVDGGDIDGRPFETLFEDEETEVSFSPAMTVGRVASRSIDVAYDPDEKEDAE